MRYFVCLVLGPVMAASRDRGYGVDSQGTIDMTKAGNAMIHYTMVVHRLLPYPLVFRQISWKNVHPGPKQISQYMPWALAQTPD